MDERTVRVAAQEGGERIDKYLAAYGEPFVSRNFVQSLIADGRVRVNGSVVNRPSFRLSAGDVIEVVLPLPPSPVPEPEAIPLDIVYEDGSVIVVNKPRGMVVHPAPGNTEGTLVNALLAHCELRGVGSKERPGIVHRLDKGTSGLMVVAKEPMAYMDLVRQLQARTVVRRYVAFVHGKVPDERWTVNAPIGRDPLNRQRMAVLPDGKPAVTHFTCLERFGAFSSVRAELVTGRTHQIRVHMAHIGHPLVGDRRYGAPRDPALPDEGIALHAYRLEFVHPRTGELLSFEADLPEDMRRLRKTLG